MPCGPFTSIPPHPPEVHHTSNLVLEMSANSPLGPVPKNLPQAPTEVLRDLRRHMQIRHAALKAAGVKLNIARGKPCTEQVSLADQLLMAVGPENCVAEEDTDCRNYYGSPQGLIEARHDAVVFSLLKGVGEGAAPWRRNREPVLFLCPSPGYDRHFAICEQYDIRMIPVRLTGHGPDMEEVERLVA